MLKTKFPSAPGFSIQHGMAWSLALPRAKNAEAATGVLLGIVVIVWMTFSPRSAAWPEEFRSPFHTFLTVVAGTLTILLVGLLLARFRNNSNAKQPTSSLQEKKALDEK